MRRKHINRITLLLLVALVAGMGWLTWREIDQQQQNRALIEAIRSDDEGLVELLLNDGADPNSYEKGEQSSLWQFLLDRLHGNSEDKGLSALWIAVSRSYPQIVELLVKHGADVNVKRKDTGMTPLMSASIDGDPRIVAYLLGHGADIHAKSSKGETALDLALRMRYPPASMLAHLRRITRRPYRVPPSEAANYDHIIQMLKQAGAKE